MLTLNATKTPLMGDLALYRMEEVYQVAFIVDLPSGRGIDYTKTPITLAVFNLVSKTVDFVDATYGIEEGQWLFRGDFGIR